MLSKIEVCRLYFGTKTGKQLNILLELYLQVERGFKRLEFVLNMSGFLLSPILGGPALLVVFTWKISSPARRDLALSMTTSCLVGLAIVSCKCKPFLLGKCIRKRYLT